MPPMHLPMTRGEKTQQKKKVLKKENKAKRKSTRLLRKHTKESDSEKALKGLPKF